MQEFLTKVPSGDPAVFKKFFADEVIYTRASGLEIGKSDVLARTGGSQAGDPNVTFTGEDFIVHTYGNFAVVNFRLVMHSNKDEKITTQSFRNTGTFMKRNGEWQAIAWQATPIADK
ncbi:MAG TPA: nuclear transport factor 2 family protein [Terriglobales bacterium]|nr:nuclear transport factor 2 family protein [Terriglobales bacterium]